MQTNSKLADEDDSTTGVAAVDRAVKIVAALEQTPEPVTLSELSRLTGLYKSTLLRLLASLKRSALVAQRTDGRYVLGPFCARLGRAFDAGHHLQERVVPVLHRLVDQGTESSSFHIRYDDDTRLCLFRVDSSHSTLDSVRAGDLLPIKRGAAANVIRYYLDNERHNPAQDPLLFLSFGERDALCAGMASPIFGDGGHFVGALSLSGPKDRFTDKALKKMSKILLAESKALTEALGGVWPKK